MFRSALVFVVVLAPAVAHAQSPDKLTTVLADLAGSRLNTTASAGTAPQSVQEAIRHQRLRVDATDRVQVYILLAAVTDDAVRQLADAGATIELRDAARRRVQARVPISALHTVAALPVVNAIRL